MATRTKASLGSVAVSQSFDSRRRLPGHAKRGSTPTPSADPPGSSRRWRPEVRVPPRSVSLAAARKAKEPRSLGFASF